MGIKAWEKGENDIDRRQRTRIVLDLLVRQLKSIHRYHATVEGEKYILFKGDDKSLKFVSNISLLPGCRSGLTYVNYLVRKDSDYKKEDLIFSETKTPIMNMEEEPTGIDEESSFYLFPEIHSLGFEYLKRSEDEKDFQWQSTFDAKEEGSLPEAVKIELKEPGDEDAITVIAPILIEVGS